MSTDGAGTSSAVSSVASPVSTTSRLVYSIHFQLGVLIIASLIIVHIEFSTGQPQMLWLASVSELYTIALNCKASSCSAHLSHPDGIVSLFNPNPYRLS